MLWSGMNMLLKHSVCRCLDDVCMMCTCVQMYVASSSRMFPVIVTSKTCIIS